MKRLLKWKSLTYVKDPISYLYISYSNWCSCYLWHVATYLLYTLFKAWTTFFSRPGTWLSEDNGIIWLGIVEVFQVFLHKRVDPTATSTHTTQGCTRCFVIQATFLLVGQTFQIIRVTLKLALHCVRIGWFLKNRPIFTQCKELSNLVWSDR